MNRTLRKLCIQYPGEEAVTLLEAFCSDFHITCLWMPHFQDMKYALPPRGKNMVFCIWRHLICLPESFFLPLRGSLLCLPEQYFLPIRGRIFCLSEAVLYASQRTYCLLPTGNLFCLLKEVFCDSPEAVSYASQKHYFCLPQARVLPLRCSNTASQIE